MERKTKTDNKQSLKVLTMILHYLKMAFRSLGKYRMQNIISIVSLAVALFCFSINMYISRFMIQIDNWLDDRVVFMTDVNGGSSVNFDLAKEITAQRPEIEALVRFNPYVRSSWKKADDKSSIANTDYFIHTDTTLLDVLGLKLIAGNWKSVCNTNAKHCLALSESFARKQYGSADAAVGQEILIEELGVVTVQAVVQDLPFANSIMNFEYAAGWMFSKDDEFLSGRRFGYVWVKLKEGIDSETFCNTPYSVWLDDERAISSDSYWNLKDKDINIGGGIKFTTTSPGKSDWGFLKTSLRLMLISLPGILILIVALFNYFHLLVNSILSNRREYALRRVHGARTADMWRMVSTQIVVVTILTGILSLFIARYVTPMIRVADSQGPGVTQFFMDTNVIIRHTLEYIVLLVAAGLLIAWIAVTRVKHADMSDSLKRRYGGRNFMLGVQLTVAQLMITILVAMFLKMRSNLTEPYSWLSKEDKTCIITDGKYFGSRDDMELEISYLKSLPYITHAVCMFREHLSGSPLGATEFNISGYSDETDCYRVFIDSEMMDMLGVKIRKGRMPVRSTEIMVDDLYTERFGLDLGDTMRIKDFLRNYPDADFVYSGDEADWLPLVIVGHIDNLLDKATINGSPGVHKPAIYCNWKNLSGFVVIRCLPGHQKEAREAIVKYHNPGSVYEDYNGTMSIYDYMDQSNSVWNSIGFIAWIVAIIAFIITLLGVYSAISIDTSRRRKEMALRKINGAKTSQITMQFANLYIKLFIISSVVSIPLSAFIIKQAILSGQPLEKGAGYPILFYLFILAVMVVFVSLTIGFKIYGIARENPADVVKSE